MITRRLLASLVICLAMILIVVSGCGSETTDTTTAPAQTTATTAAQASTTTAPAMPALDEAKAFYEGKTIKIEAGVAGTAPDLFSRLYGKYLAEATGAKLIVTNYSDIGGLEAINVAYKAEPDGLTLGCHDATSIIHNSLLGEPVAKYDLSQLVFVGGMGSSDMALWVKAGGKYDSVEDLQAAKGLLMAAASPLGYFAFWGSWGSHALGLDFASVLGIGGPNQAKLSVMQGETDYVNIMTLEPGLQPDLKPVVMIAPERDILVHDVPTIGEVVNLTDAQKAELTLCNKVTQFMPLIALPPGVPEDRVAFLDQFTADLANNAAFMDELKQLFGFSILYDGNYVEDAISYLVDHKADLEALKTMVQSYYK